MTPPLTVLVVEDEPLIAMMLEDFLEALGHNVAGTIDTVEQARARAAQGGFDFAVLDVQLADGPSWPVADTLADRGIPFVIASGGHVEPPPPRHAGVPVLPKPFTVAGLEEALAAFAAQKV